MNESIQAESLKDIDVTRQITEEVTLLEQLPQTELAMLRSEIELKQTQTNDLFKEVGDLKQELSEFPQYELQAANELLASDEKQIQKLEQQICEESSQITAKITRLRMLL